MIDAPIPFSIAPSRILGNPITRMHLAANRKPAAVVEVKDSGTQSREQISNAFTGNHAIQSYVRRLEKRTLISRAQMIPQLQDVKLDPET